MLRIIAEYRAERERMRSKLAPFWATMTMRARWIHRASCFVHAMSNVRRGLRETTSADARYRSYELA